MDSLQYTSRPPLRKHVSFYRRSFVALLVLFFLVPRSEALQASLSETATSTCTTSSPSSAAYSVTTCITSPSNGATLAGDATVTATVSVAGTSPGVRSVLFSLNGAYLITDFQSTYTFVLTTAHWIDGGYTIGAQPTMRDGYVAQSVSISVGFSNGVTSPPVNTNHFQPTSGRTPASGSPYIVAAVGDGASGETYAGKVSNLISAANPNLFLYLGDVYQDGSYPEFYNWYGNSTYFARMRSITDPTVGNHEYLTQNASGYFFYWDSIPPYYSYNANGWHFISLDSNGSHVPTGSGSAQYTWLQSDLASLPANTCTVAYYHHPLYNLGPEGSATGMSAIWKLLAQYGVAIVLNGHDHDYQRWVALDGSGNPSSTGVTEFVDGGGGHGLQTFTHTDSRVAYSNDTNPTAFGALFLQLNQSGANFSYENTSGTFLDSGVIPCHAGNPDSMPPSTPGNLTATAASSTRVNLTWSASSDNVGVAGYTIYRNGTAIKTVPAVQPSYSDTSVIASTTYSYTVDAFDLSGNHSPQSTPVLVTTSTSSGAYVFGDSADTYVSSAYPNTNYGTATILKVDGSPTIHSYLRFSVQGLGSQPVASAKLRLYTNQSTSAGIEALTVANNTWSETSMTYNTAPAMGGALSSSGAYSAGTWVSLDVTSYVTGNGDYSFGVTTPGSSALTFPSKEASSNQPQLVITLGTSSTATPTSTPTPARTPTATPAATSTPIATPKATFTPTPGSTPTPTATSSSGGTMTFLPGADSYVNSSYLGTNYGTSTSLRADASPIVNSYVRFSVSGLNGASITKARLSFYMNSRSSAGMKALVVSDNTWGETTITYSNAPAMGSTIATSGALTAGTWVTLDVTSYVTAEGTYSFGIITPGSTAINFASRESGANAPQLVVTFGP